ncbi:hypothetical protein PFISCL1PPCAC_8471, partial [Pristionchus fissidentatus]
LEKISPSIFNNAWNLLRNLQHAKICTKVCCHEVNCSKFKRANRHLIICANKSHRICNISKLLLAHGRKEHAAQRDDMCPMCKQTALIHRIHPGKSPKNYEKKEENKSKKDQLLELQRKLQQKLQKVVNDLQQLQQDEPECSSKAADTMANNENKKPIEKQAKTVVSDHAYAETSPEHGSAIDEVEEVDADEEEDAINSDEEKMKDEEVEEENQQDTSNVSLASGKEDQDEADDKVERDSDEEREGNQNANANESDAPEEDGADENE